MKRVATAALAGLVLLAGFIGTSPAHAADGYGGATVRVKISHKAVEEKEDFTLKASVKTSTNKPVDCTKIVYRFNGDSNTSGKFTAPKVSDDKRFPISAKCFYKASDLVTLGGGSTGSLSTFVIVPQASEVGSNTILVLDNDKSGKDDDDDNKDDDDDNGNLPNTGGERLAWLVIGLLLVAAGSTVVVSSRKRDSVA